MSRPALGPVPAAKTMRRKHSGRLRAYAVHAAPRPSRKTVRFRCRNCGQKVLVQIALARSAINCPTCQRIIPPPHPGRMWMEIFGAVLVFTLGVAAGQGPLRKPEPAAIAPTAVLQKDGKVQITKQSPSKPNWFSSQVGDEP